MNAPKGTVTAELRSQIDERKAELLAFLHDHASPASSAPSPIPRRVSKDPAPLSFAQERLWFLEKLESGSAVYNICRASRLTGQLNIAALESSLTEILRRHEILRSEIRIVDRRPVEVAVAVPRFEVPVIDLRSLTEAERDREVRDRIKAEAEWHFDFSAGLFFRAVLLQISDEQYILILTTHHIVSDAWSMGTLTKEVWTLYEAYANGRPSPLQELPVQYADYAVWQREWLQGNVLEPQLSYWKEQLNELPILDLPTDHPRPVKQSFRGARQSLSLPESLTKAVNELSGREGVTQFMTLLAVFQVLLYRYSGQEDVVVGSPIANRNRTETEELIGFFVNTLVLRADLSEKPTFKELLQRVRDVCLGAYAHQDLPFEKLVEELRPERDLSRNPLFQVMFVLQNTPRPLPQTAGLSIERVDVLPATSLFDLSLYLRERDGKLIGFFEYNTDLFEPSTIERMIGHFQTLLEAIVADSEQPISTLPLLSQAERHQLLVEWNDTGADYPKDSGIHELFEAQVERTPEAIAIQFEGAQLTYQELNRRANQLAQYLQTLGIGPEKLVGICIERSIEMVIGLLGILKAGGAYVPLDPSYPRERLAFMLEDSHVSVLLTQEGLIEDRITKTVDADPQSSILNPRTGVVCLDADWATIARESEQNLRSEIKPDNLAYVIYTSGSTGTPKGVRILHQSLVNCVHFIWQHLGLTESDVFLAITSISFDIAALELYLPLVTGAKIILANRDDALAGRQLLTKITAGGVTVVQATPSTWQLLPDSGWQGNESFKILCGGEVLSRRLADELVKRGSLWNLYGPTETTIWSTVYKVRPGEGPVPIGRPIKNTQVYILDTNLRLVPVGVYGELYIGGAGVAQGYLNRPVLTEERFIPNPFTTEPDSRLYRTGDMVRYRREGTIEYRGRSDNQVKIRGHRVELGEIEAVLNQHPGVKESVVAFHEREPCAEKMLAAYFVPKHQPAPAVTELRNFLAEKLPSYMIPYAFVSLETIPKTPNGKIDRNALPALDGTRPDLTHTFVEPRTEIEDLIAQVWGEVLKLDRIGVYDNFFELGGHSLKAIQIIARLQEALNQQIPLRLIFEAPILSALASKIRVLPRNDDQPELPAILPMPGSGPFPLSCNQEYLWHLTQMIPNNNLFKMPYVFHINGDLNVVALKSAIEEIVRRHEALRTVFRDVGGQPVQVIQEAPDFIFPVIELHSLPQQDLFRQAARVILGERQQLFALDAGPLFRAKLVRLTDADYFLLVTMHHIIGDDWSMGIFQRELAILYGAFSKGGASPLPEVPIQFADYAVWEKQSTKSGLFDAQLEYWRKELAVDPHQLGFKNGREEEANKKSSFRTAREQIEIDESLFLEVRRLSHKEGFTPFTVFLAALNMTIHFYTGEEDIRIGIVTANREGRDRASVMGNFTNTIILRTKIEPTSNARQLLRQVRDNILTGYSNQELPFEYMAQILERECAENQSTRFAVQVIYNNVTDKIEFPGLSFAPFSIRALGTDPGFMISDVDMIFRLQELSTKLTGSLTYKTGSINQSRAASIIELFKTILSLLINKTDSSLSSILCEKAVMQIWSRRTQEE